MEPHVIWGEHVMFKERSRLQPCRYAPHNAPSAPEAMLLVFPFFKPSLDISGTSLYCTSLIETSLESKNHN
jgi:hypothetical protein